jgi:hypothetical protein
MLRSCPTAGTGVHNWLIRLAVRLHRYFPDKDDIAALLEKYSAHCGRPVEDDEIWQAIENSEKWLAEQQGQSRGDVAEEKRQNFNRRSTPNLKYASTPKWPEVNRDLVESLVKAGPDLNALIASSPVRPTDQGPRAEEIMATLFPKDSLICVGSTQEVFKTGRMAQWIHFRLLRQMQFIVPSPMTAVHGTTKNGKESMHTLENTGSRRFLVVEFDQGVTDEHSALLWHLGQREPLVMVVHSGGKSLHGWFFCHGRDEAELFQFMQYAVSLGADRATWTKSQFVRIPNGLRDNGKRQQVVYFNPNLLDNQ